MRFGAHMPTSGGVWKALERGGEVGCQVVQLFVKNNMQWAGRPFRPEELARYSEARSTQKFEAIFGHTGYLINIAGPPGPKRDQSLRSLVQEIELAAELELPFLVLHPGAHLGLGEEEGLQQAARGLDEVFEQTRRCRVRIALENTAGQGTCLGGSLAHLAELFQRVKRPQRLGVCLDTCHFFAAGYDIRTPAGWDAAIAEAERLIGLDQVLAFHLNDSKGALGSHLDRHAGIGEGLIGKKGFATVVNDPRFAECPGCIETPKSDDLHEDVQNLKTLRALVKKGSGKPRLVALARGRAGAAPLKKRLRAGPESLIT